MSDHHNCDHPLFQVLLIAKVLVRCQKQLISSLLGGSEKVPVSETRPSQIRRDANDVVAQIAAPDNGEWGTGVP